MNQLRNKTAALSPDSRGLLERVLDTSDFALVVPRLSPDVLHRIVQRCGLEDCGELLAMATPEQLAGVLDLDLWRADQPGMDEVEQFDAERFGVWLEVLAESGADAAAADRRAYGRRSGDGCARPPRARVRSRGTLAIHGHRRAQLRGRRLSDRRDAHRLLGRDRRRADIPRCRASRLFSSRHARVQAAVEFPAGNRRAGQPAHGPGTGIVRPGVPSRTPKGAARIRDARAGSRVSPDVARSCASGTTRRRPQARSPARTSGP